MDVSPGVPMGTHLTKKKKKTGVTNQSYHHKIYTTVKTVLFGI